MEESKQNYFVDEDEFVEIDLKLIKKIYSLLMDENDSLRHIDISTEENERRFFLLRLIYYSNCSLFNYPCHVNNMSTESLEYNYSRVNDLLKYFETFEDLKRNELYHIGRYYLITDQIEQAIQYFEKCKQFENYPKKINYYLLVCFHQSEKLEEYNELADDIDNQNYVQLYECQCLFKENKFEEMKEKLDTFHFNHDFELNDRYFWLLTKYFCYKLKTTSDEMSKTTADEQLMIKAKIDSCFDQFSHATAIEYMKKAKLEDLLPITFSLMARNREFKPENIPLISDKLDICVSDQSLKYIRKAAELEHSDALYILANNLYIRNKNQNDHIEDESIKNEIFSYLQRSIKYRHVRAKYLYAKINLDQSSELSEEKELYYIQMLQQSADAGYSIAQYEYATKCYDCKNHDDGDKYLFQAAKQKNSDALELLDLFINDYEYDETPKSVTQIAYRYKRKLSKEETERFEQEISEDEDHLQNILKRQRTK